VLHPLGGLLRIVVLIKIRNHDVCSFTREGDRDSAAYAGVTAGD
jgi:hypothetical protein